MASLINSPLLDETGKAILAALQGEEPAEQSGSKIKAPMSDETGKAILEFLQNGGGGGGSEPLVVNITTEDTVETLDKTWKEIKDAFDSGTIVLVRYNDDWSSWSGQVISYKTDGHQYDVTFVRGQDVVLYYSASSEDGYPEYSFG